MCVKSKQRNLNFDTDEHIVSNEKCFNLGKYLLCLVLIYQCLFSMLKKICTVYNTSFFLSLF